MILNIRKHLSLLLVLDYYTTQFLTGHGNFNAKLRLFVLVLSGSCWCRAGDELVKHVLFYCDRVCEEREWLKIMGGQTVSDCVWLRCFWALGQTTLLFLGGLLRRHSFPNKMILLFILCWLGFIDRTFHS